MADLDFNVPVDRPDALTIRDLMALFHCSETATRDRVRTLVSQGRAERVWVRRLGLAGVVIPMFAYILKKKS